MVQSVPETFGSLAVSRNNKLLATASGVGRGIRIWEIESGRLLCQLRSAILPSNKHYGLPGMTFSADAALLASAGESHEIVLWDLRRCEESKRIRTSFLWAHALSTLADGRVLVSAGGLYVADLFRGSGQFTRIPSDSVTTLLGHTEDGKIILEGTGGAYKGTRREPFAVQVRDLDAARALRLSEFSGAEAADSAVHRGQFPPAAALSSSGRWIVVQANRRLTLFDRETRKVAASVSLEQEDAHAAVARHRANPPPAPTPEDLREFRQIQQEAIARLDEDLKTLPPADREKMRAKLTAIIMSSDPERDHALGPDPNAPPMSEAHWMTRRAAWLGFSADEERVYVWRNMAGQPSAQGNVNPLTFQVRRRSDLELSQTHDFDEVLSANPYDALMAETLLQTQDRKLLALSGMGWGKLGVVDLSGATPRLRVWTPSGGTAEEVAWPAEGQLITVKSGQLPWLTSSLSPRGAGSAGAAPRHTGPVVLSGLVRWDLKSGDVIDLAIDQQTTLPSMAGNARYAAHVTSGFPQRGARSETEIEVVDLTTLQPVWKGPLLQPSGQPIPGSLVPVELAVSPDGKHVAGLWRSSAWRGRAPEVLRKPDPNGSWVAIFETGSGRAIFEQQVPFLVGVRPNQNYRRMAFTPDGWQLVLSGRNEVLLASMELPSIAATQRLATGSELYGVASANPLRVVVAEAPKRKRARRTTPKVAQALSIQLEPFRDRHTASNASGTLLAATAADDTIELYRVLDGVVESPPRSLVGHSPARITAMAFSPDSRYLVSASEDASILLWDLERGVWLAKLYSFVDGTWAVVDPSGRFDSNNPQRIEQLHWVLPDDPFHALTLDVFMRDYHEPKLLPKLMAGEKLRSVLTLKRTEPRPTARANLEGRTGLRRPETAPRGDR